MEIFELGGGFTGDAATRYFLGLGPACATLVRADSLSTWTEDLPPPDNLNFGKKGVSAKCKV